MPCPLCTNKENSFHYSGADRSFEENWLPGRLVARAQYGVEPMAQAPAFEIRVCDTCSTPWMFDFFFPDHPPLIVFGTALIDAKRHERALAVFEQYLKALHTPK